MPFKLALPLLPALCVSLVLAAAAAPASLLAAERWNKRVVLVFAAERGDALRSQVDALLADRDALAEREMLVLAIAGDSVSPEFGRIDGPPPDAAALRAAYRVAPDVAFAAILVGKDGGEKLRRSEPVAAKDIFALIDSMPMRRSEMKK